MLSFVSSIIREVASGCEKRPKSSALEQPLQVKPPKSKPYSIDQFKGQKVIARSTDDGYYYGGKSS